MKSDSREWLERQPINSLDWVYIDSAHEYSQTKSELSKSALAVKPGGFICGHDYDAQQFPGVVQAVSEFCSRHNLTAEIFDGDQLASFRIEVAG